jgi:hypothetical protein
MRELRNMPQGHPDYRFNCQEMLRKIQEVHPMPLLHAKVRYIPLFSSSPWQPPKIKPGALPK